MLIDKEVHLYRTGGCFAMAQALHELTGHPVRHIDYGNLVHAFVVTPENEVIDIHGKHTWSAFLKLLVKEGGLPGHANEAVVTHDPIPEPPSLLWLERGYSRPSAYAIERAKKVAKSHPNLIGVL